MALNSRRTDVLELQRTIAAVGTGLSKCKYAKPGTRIDNLLRIKKVGAKQWLKEQEAKWKCPKCGGNICIIDKECYDCRYKIV